MPIALTMPALSPTMESGTLAKWLVKEGDTIEAGDVIAEIETDKATMEVEAVDEGTMGKILIEGGTENVCVNAPIAILLEDGESVEALEGFVVETAPPQAQEEAQTDAEEIKATGTGGGAALSPSPQASSGPAQNVGTLRIFATPLARRLADQKNIDLGSVRGSGPHGRIIKADIENFQAGAVPSSAANQDSPISYGLANARGEKHSSMRKIIAKRLLESKQTVPHYYLTIECRIDSLLAARKEINTAADGAYKVSVNDFLIKACAMALQAYPRANVAWTDDEMLYFDQADISVAVATPAGLITPIVRKAEARGLADISAEVKSLAAKAKDGKLKPEEFQGGTFTISNLGMYGIDEFSAIINPPQSCIFAVGAGVEKPYVDNGEIKIGTFMKGTLSCDHRVIDGAVGAEFLRF